MISNYSEIKHIIWGPVELSSSACESSEADEEKAKARRELLAGVTRVMHSEFESSSSNGHSPALHRSCEPHHRLAEQALADDQNDSKASSSGASPNSIPVAPPDDAHPRRSWSVGSVLHSSGGCKPCQYSTGSRECKQGAACKFCHLCDVKRPRPRKAVRERCKQMAQRLDEFHSNPEALEVVATAMAQKSAYMDIVVKGKLKLLGEEQEADSSPDACSEDETEIERANKIAL